MPRNRDLDINLNSDAYDARAETLPGTAPEKIFAVGEFIELLNVFFKRERVRLAGEICQLKRAPSGHVYFSIKDKNGAASMDCIIWNRNYELCGVPLEVGMEVMLAGHPNIYAQSGRLSFVADTVQLVGDGALKKAYEKLRAKLEAEGLFEAARKRPLPAYPVRIGVITSVHGAVIHDFSNNLRRSGFKVRILDCRVEGPDSGRALALSVRAMRAEPLDVLVLIRGGGSIQSLAGFDNEALVREIARFPVPVMTGIGHHQDVPLAALVADVSQSTPSLVAAELGKSWSTAEHAVERSSRRIFASYESALDDARGTLTATFAKAETSFKDILERHAVAKDAVRQGFAKIAARIGHLERDVADAGGKIVRAFDASLAHTRDVYCSQIPRQVKGRYEAVLRGAAEKVVNLSRLIDSNNPERQLRMGYSIAFREGKVVRSVKEVAVGEAMVVRVADGEIGSEIKTVQ